MNNQILIGTPTEVIHKLYNYINVRKVFTLTTNNIFLYKQCIDYISNRYSSCLITQHPNTLQIKVSCTEHILKVLLNHLPEGVQCDTH